MGSSSLLRGRNAGLAFLEKAIVLAPENPHVWWLAGDAFTYGAIVDPERAFDAATEALGGGLNTPRVRAILAASYLAFGDLAAAAAEIMIHLDLVTTELVTTAPLAAGSISLGLVPGRTYDIPIPATQGETISILTSAKGFFDTILALLAPDGTPILGSDDFKNYFAGFVSTVPADGIYRLRVTSFEGVSTGTLYVNRK
jgi:hypothetical protein